MKKLFWLFLPLFLVLPFMVHAQADIRFSSVSVDILPEYDRSSVLFIYRVSIKPVTQTPIELNIRIPSSSQINAVAIFDSTRGLLDAPYEVSLDGEWSVLKIITNTQNIQFEYYADLSKVDQVRNITYEWTGDYAVEKLIVNFLVPNESKGLSIVPPAIFTGYGLEGLSNYQIQMSNLAKDQTYNISYRYSRVTDDLEISNLPIVASSTPGLETPGRVSITGVLPWILGTLGITLMVIGIIGLIVWQREGKQINKDKETVKGNKGDQIYCKECGKRTHSGDSYCRHCGKRL